MNPPEQDHKRVTPRIYVGAVSDDEQYARLHGQWVDATADLEKMQAVIDTVIGLHPTRMRGRSWNVYDSQGFFGLDLGEDWRNLPYVQTLAKGILAYGEPFAKWSQIVVTAEELGDFEHRYIGHFKSELPMPNTSPRTSASRTNSTRRYLPSSSRTSASTLSATARTSSGPERSRWRPGRKECTSSMLRSRGHGVVISTAMPNEHCLGSYVYEWTNETNDSARL